MIYLSLLISIIGLVIYLAADAKPAEVGRAMFWVGLLAFLLVSVPKIVAVLH